MLTRCPADVLALALVLGALWQALHGAPLAELSGDHDFQLFLHKNLEFTRKIRGDVAALQRVVVSAPITRPSPPTLSALWGSDQRPPHTHPIPSIPALLGPPHVALHPCIEQQVAALSSYTQSWGGSRIPRGCRCALAASRGVPDSAALTHPHPQCDTFQLCTEEELQLVRPDPPLMQAPLDQCHKRGFQAVSGRPPV